MEPWTFPRRKESYRIKPMKNYVLVDARRNVGLQSLPLHAALGIFLTNVWAPRGTLRVIPRMSFFDFATHYMIIDTD